MVKKIEFITGFDINETFFGVQTVSAKGGKELADKINELICVVNKLHIEANNNARIRASHEKQIDELKTKDKPELTDEDLRNMMRDPKYWRDGDSATIRKVQNGFNKLYGGNK
jgi:hypothetical protein